jgi:hypothetical protein
MRRVKFIVVPDHDRLEAYPTHSSEYPFIDRPLGMDQFCFHREVPNVPDIAISIGELDSAKFAIATFARAWK